MPRSTVRDWLAGRTPRHRQRRTCCLCDADGDGDAGLTAEYVHLLGLYLGDGCLSSHPRGVYKLRLFLDLKYPELIAAAADSIAVVRGRRGHRRETETHCVELFSYWRHWPCHFPQHGAGPKHLRRIELVGWQHALVARRPDQLLRGLIESDGCRFQNTGRGGWSSPRYKFSNHSADIHEIFRAACDRVGVHWTTAPHTTYVSRIADVAILDQFIGPKR